MAPFRHWPLPQAPPQLLDLVAPVVDDLAPLANRPVPHSVVECAWIGEESVVVTPIFRNADDDARGLLPPGWNGDRRKHHQHQNGNP
jgi:hypothetical protein